LLGGAADGTMMSGGDTGGTPAMVGVPNQVACDGQVCTSHAYCCYAPAAAECLQGDGLNCVHKTLVNCDSIASGCTGGDVCCQKGSVVSCSASCAGPTDVQLCSPTAAGECR